MTDYTEIFNAARVKANKEPTSFTITLIHVSDRLTAELEILEFLRQLVALAFGISPALMSPSLKSTPPRRAKGANDEVVP